MECDCEACSLTDDKHHSFGRFEEEFGGLLRGSG
jgi:hypothetical protein